jgi:hypothetical protein
MSDESPIDVREIMMQIERQVWAKDQDQDELWLPDLDPELRAHLIRLHEIAGSLQLDVPVVEQSPIPLVGPLVTWWRTKLHQIVLFYINSVTRHQVAFVQAMTRAVIYLAEHLDAENKALQAEVEDLRRQLAQTRDSSREE